MKKIRSRIFGYKFFYQLILLTLCFAFSQSCKKISSSENDLEVTSNRYIVAEKFLKLPANADPALIRVATEIKKINDKKEYLTKFSNENGFPVWDKVMKSTKPNNGGSNSFASGIVEEGDTLVIIPLVSADSSYVNGFISAKLSGDVTLDLYRGGDYSIYSLNDVPTDSINADKAALQIMALNKIVFGHTQFLVNDNRLFSNFNQYDATLPSRKFTLIDSVATQNLNTIYMCDEYCMSWQCSICHGNDPDCPFGGSGSICWETCFEMPDGGGIPGGDTGGGGGGTGSGGTNYPCPSAQGRGIAAPCCNCTPTPPPIIIIPTPPSPIYECNYTLTAAHQQIFDQINAEDEEANSNSQNNNCKGTKRTGNVNFQGTVEHWLIQLDYVSKNPLNGEIEYSIPNASLANPANRGFADMVDTHYGTMFEIKPNNPAGLANGTIEVQNYVNKANSNCNPPTQIGTNWSKGTSYNATFLPTSTPNRYLKAEYIGPGVVGYGYVTTTNPIPSPVLVPQSVIDKLKHLIDRLKNNVTDANKIIAEYLHQHPELITYIKSAAIGAGVAIIIGTIIEDVLTMGAGILDDVASFALAYKIIRFAVIL
jgi:hypothetical protein